MHGNGISTRLQIGISHLQKLGGLWLGHGAQSRSGRGGAISHSHWDQKTMFFPTCQVRVVRFYVSCLLLLSSPLLISSPPRRPPRRPPPPTATRDPQCSLSDLNHDHPRTVFSVGPQPRPSTPSVPCRTSTTTIPAQCSLPDLNHDHPRPVLAAGPQPWVSPPSVPCRTSTTSIHAKRYAT